MAAKNIIVKAAFDLKSSHVCEQHSKTSKTFFFLHFTLPMSASNVVKT